MTERLGTPRVHLRRTDSTNERAKELALSGAPHGTLVTAGEQTAGRGRQGRTWTAAPGEALLISIVLRELRPTLPLTAAVAICEALPVECAIKWPNDIWIDGRKLAGILVEGRPQEGWAVLGIGLNVATETFPPELDGIATSLRLAGHVAEHRRGAGRPARRARTLAVGAGRTRAGGLARARRSARPPRALGRRRGNRRWDRLDGRANGGHRGRTE